MRLVFAVVGSLERARAAWFRSKINCGCALYQEDVASLNWVCVAGSAASA